MPSRALKFNSPLVIITGMLLLLISCHRYFMPVQQDTGTPAIAGNFIATNSIQKYFILRKGTQSIALHEITVNQQNMTLSGRLAAVQPTHRLYLEAEKNNMKYKDNESGAILNEVHIFLSDQVKLDTAGSITLPLDQIVKIEVIQHDRKRTNSSYVLGGVGIGLGVLVLAGVIIALTKSSCPFISVYDGQQYNLQGELFGGAVNARLERTDFVPLLASPVNGQYELRISNELRERQFTNFADLWVVEHPEKTQVIPGEDGTLYSILQPVNPVTALLNNRDNVLPRILQPDQQACSFNDSTNLSGINELVMDFPLPDTRNGNAKLLLRLKNAYWFDYLFGEFTRKFGNSYANWQEQQKKRTAEEMIRWTEEQAIPLRIELLTGKGWQEISRLRTVGPIAQRTLVVPVDIKAAAGTTIQLRLSTGFMFWELDQATMDFSPDSVYTMTRIKPSTAVDERGISVLPALQADDSIYLIQPEPGNHATLTYTWNKQPAPGNRYTVILHTKGYYEPVRDYKGSPEMAELKKFREPGALARFSLDLYQRIPKEHQLIALENR